MIIFDTINTVIFVFDTNVEILQNEIKIEINFIFITSVYYKTHFEKIIRYSTLSPI